jgi:uroporphyrinogen decarboxylase
MDDRARILAVLDYQPYDRLPVVHFGFLGDTLKRWEAEGHLDLSGMPPIGDASPGEDELSRRLGFDCNYHRVFAPDYRLDPPFERQVLEMLPAGHRKVLTGTGAIVIESDDNQSISPHVDHVLKGRADWEREFLPRLRFSPERVARAGVNAGGRACGFAEGGREYLLRPDRPTHVLLHCGSLYGVLRDYLGIENLCYLLADDEGLVDEMIRANAELCYQCTGAALASGVRFDLGHFWEDIAFRNGPLVNPAVLRAKVGPHYRRFADLLRRHGIDLVSLDCDGDIASLVPVWLEAGINVMFPIEVGTWQGSFGPWRERYGRELRGVGGMDKRVFAKDCAAVDAEIERLKPLVDLGGYLPCPDHRIAADARWENVQYYCERLRRSFGG